ncbi:hypothetical protein KP509_04G067700 [Ceratopteris richardii]|uniref:Nudix hydrolase domain-containing protein n=1 Tax=Ceratopteris richardii TaxID=49495 RepID=A0A8T2UXR2_CERRI|nr:hypothetical protein KP509_04G067700 [Ceratopteris richardii]
MNMTETGIGSMPDADPLFEILVAFPAGLSASQVHVDFGSSHDRQPHPDRNLEGKIDEIWIDRLQRNPYLFNASKFRYGGYNYLPSEEGGGDDVCLCLGLTDYKTFVGTNLSPHWENFLNPLKDDIERYIHMSNPLGNGAIVETEDNCILVLKRSRNVGEFPGHFVFPGGHSEPQEIGILSHDLYEDNIELNRKIADEMYTGIIREIVEETGIPTDFLGTPLFIGLSRRILNARPTAFFFVRCSLTSAEVFRFYSQAQHKFESTELNSIPRENLAGATANMPGCHQGGAFLYALMSKSKTKQ